MPVSQEEKEKQLDNEKKKLKSYGIDEEKIQMLKNFVSLLKLDSSVLSFSCLEFFKNWLVDE